MLKGFDPEPPQNLKNSSNINNSNNSSIYYEKIKTLFNTVGNKFFFLIFEKKIF